MKRQKNLLQMLLSASCLSVLILDSKTAIVGASEGIALCIKSVIPSLFPFLMFSILLTSALVGQEIAIMSKFGKICRLPRNTEALFLIGLLGGYPIGAKVISEAYRNSSLSENTAHRLLGFCNNAGPAFIFGIAGCLFFHTFIPWLLWLIHLASAIIVGVVLPGTDANLTQVRQSEQITVQKAFTRSLHVMASICGWIILFRVLITFLDRWFLWLLPETASVFIFGCLELANGIISLQNIELESYRFILSSIFLGFGGVCVAMQTASVTGSLGTGLYLPGKILQSAISGIMSAIAAMVIYPECPYGIPVLLISAIISVTLVIILRNGKIPVAFSMAHMYNNQKSSRELPICSFGKR